MIDTSQNLEAPVFLLGSGRSGTTLVQRLLNTYPDTMIWGEHAGFLKEIAEAYFNITRSDSMHEFSYSQSYPDQVDVAAEFFKSPERWQAWNNWFQPENITQSFQQMLSSMFNPTVIGSHKHWGFKEIRYGVGDKVVEFLAELYPSACFIFIVRNGLNTLESQLTTFHHGQSRYLKLKRLIQLPLATRIAREWSHQNHNFLKMHKNDNLNSFLLNYEDIVQNIGVLEELLKYLGKTIGPEQERVLDMAAGRGSGFADVSNQNKRWKRLGVIPISVAQSILGSVNEELGYKTPSGLKWATFISRLYRSFRY